MDGAERQQTTPTDSTDVFWTPKIIQNYRKLFKIIFYLNKNTAQGAYKNMATVSQFRGRSLASYSLEAKGVVYYTL